jgi:diketogulonate reductase-like aldo/keto reductase
MRLSILLALTRSTCSLKLERRALLRGSGAALAAPLLPAYASSIPTWDVGNGIKMPTLALNTVGLSAEASERAVKLAVEAGIAHVDFHPGIERDGVANALRSLPRDALFLTTKVRSPQGQTLTPVQAADLVKRQLDEDRKILGVDKVDLWMLRETPNCEVIQAQWRVLEDAQSAGVMDALGVVNYCEKQLDCLLKTARVKPCLDYYCLHPGMGSDAHGLRSYAAKRGIKTFAYGAIGEPGPSRALLEGEVLTRIAKAHNVSPAQVAVRWLLQNGNAVSARPTAEFGLGTSACRSDGSCASGLRDRAFAVMGFALTAAEMREIDALAAPDNVPCLFSKACNPDLGTGSATDPLNLNSVLQGASARVRT